MRREERFDDIRRELRVGWRRNEAAMLKRNSFYQPCNHMARARVGATVRADGSFGETIQWCANCGAIKTRSGWRYPKRARRNNA